MKNRILLALLMGILASVSSSFAQLTTLLPIPARLQWDNAGGYCGETSIQMIGLYYGNYISQDFCRTVAGGEVLFGNDNGEVALDALSFTYAPWDFGSGSPQYQRYLQWVKSHISYHHPVIMTVFVAGENSPEYDHILPAIGFTSSDTTAYHDTDGLMFHDCYASTYFTRTFGSMWDTRSMNGNGATYDYCVPREVDYGVAVTGIKDLNHETLPLRMSIDRWDEPNVTQGEAPVLLNATLVGESLQVGARYALLRYDNYAAVPASGFNPAGASSVSYFTATASTHTSTATFMSNTAVFFRLVPDVFTAAEPTATAPSMALSIYPNPCTDLLHLTCPKGTKIEILDPQGRLLLQAFATQGETTLDLESLAKATYLIRITAGNHAVCHKFQRQ